MDIDRAKGLAITLVVFGHLVARADPLGVGWYEPLRGAVYSFHMPFFFYLSGMAAAYARTPWAPPVRWLELARRKAVRLLVPFAALGLLGVMGKWLAVRVMFVDHPVTNLWAAMLDLVWYTAGSQDGSVWYLVVLFMLSVAAPILVWVDAGRLRLLLILSGILYITPLPYLVYANRFGQFAVFFAAGLLAGNHETAWLDVVERHWKIWMALLVAGFAAVMLEGNKIPANLSLLMMGMISMPAIHGLVSHMPLKLANACFWLGRYCFMIYLFNTIFIGFTKGVMLHFTNWNGGHFLPFAMVLMLAGMLGPVLLKHLVFRHFAMLNRLTD